MSDSNNDRRSLSAVSDGLPDPSELRRSTLYTEMVPETELGEEVSDDDLVAAPNLNKA